MAEETPFQMIKVKWLDELIKLEFTPCCESHRLKLVSKVNQFWKEEAIQGTGSVSLYIEGDTVNHGSTPISPSVTGLERLIRETIKSFSLEDRKAVDDFLDFFPSQKLDEPFLLEGMHFLVQTVSESEEATKEQRGYNPLPFFVVVPDSFEDLCFFPYSLVKSFIRDQLVERLYILTEGKLMFWLSQLSAHGKKLENSLPLIPLDSIPGIKELARMATFLKDQPRTLSPLGKVLLDTIQILQEPPFDIMNCQPGHVVEKVLKGELPSSSSLEEYLERALEKQMKRNPGDSRPFPERTLRG